MAHGIATSLRDVRLAPIGHLRSPRRKYFTLLASVLFITAVNHSTSIAAVHPELA